VIDPRLEVDKGPALGNEVVKLEFGIHAPKLFSLPQSCVGVQNIFRAGRIGNVEIIIVQGSFIF
jgi:hypothetical protein